MRAHRCECRTTTTAVPTFVDITDDVAGALAGSGIQDGRVTLFAPEDACALLLQERESGLLTDIEQALTRVGGRVATGATTVGSRSIVLPAAEGRLRLGMWQRVLLLELGRPSTRSVVVQIMGE